jgi:Uma2 family endonuclease
VNAESLVPLLVPEEGITADNLHLIPGLRIPAHTELIDGGLFFPTSEGAFHEAMIALLEVGLEIARPPHLLVRSQIPLVLDGRTRVEPDILVLMVDAEIVKCQSGYLIEGVHLVVEVVSAASEIRDRELKPNLYARAGIQHFWRAEGSAAGSVIQTYELDPATSAYFLTGTYRDRLTCSVPYDIDVDLAALPAGA